MQILGVALVVAVAVAVTSATFHQQCSHPSPLIHGSHSGEGAHYFPVGKKISFYCNHGYRLYGRSFTVCVYSYHDNRAYWFYPIPVCKRKFVFEEPLDLLILGHIIKCFGICL